VGGHGRNSFWREAFGKQVKRDPEGIPIEPDWFYRPYAAVDKEWTDPRIFQGPPPVRPDRFRISRWDAHDAASNFIFNIKRIYDRLSSGKSGSSENEYIIPVILDGRERLGIFPRFRHNISKYIAE